MQQREYSWWDKSAALLYVVLCFEVGIFLLLFPWLEWWEKSWFSNLTFSVFGQPWEQIWDSAWFRGAVSGLGVVNILISFIEVARLRRFAEPRQPTMQDSLR